MNRVKFYKRMQRRFLDKVIENLNSPSLRGIRQFGFKINYQTLKSYYNENRTLPEDLFNDLCYLAKISPSDWKVRYLKEHWGQKLGGSR